jgi:hypothetical protein
VTATAHIDESKIAALVERLVRPGGREQLNAERDAAALAARQAEAREAIAAIAPQRDRTAKAWPGQLSKVRAAVDALVAANAALRAISETDSELYNEQDRLRMSAELREPLDPRFAGALDVDHLVRALRDLEALGRQTLASRSEPGR